MTQVFISYSRKDLPFVQQLADDLKNTGMDVWYDVSGIKGGSRWRIEIEKAVKSSHFVIVVLSPDSIASEWVEREFLFANNLKRKIIPLYYRQCELPLNYLDLNYIDVQGDNYRVNINEILRAMDQSPVSLLSQRETIKTPQSITDYLKFKTYRLENKGFLFTSTAWPFIPHPDGEDIINNYVAKSERNSKVPKRSFTSEYPTIAAKKITVEFYLVNTGPTAVYLEKVFLTVKNKFPITEHMFRNTWMPIIAPHNFEVVLEEGKAFYDMNFDGGLCEMNPTKSEHFRVCVVQGNMVTDQIWEFDIGVIYHDLAGNNGELISDRTYHLAVQQNEL